MTAMTTPYRSGLLTGRAGFAQLLHAEWTKFRTVRGWVMGILAAAVVIVLVGLLGPAGSSITCAGVGSQGERTGQACTNVPPVGPDGEPVTDRFFFVHRPLTGDGSITVRVTSLTGLLRSSPDEAPRSHTEPWSKAGIIIKDGTRQGSAYAAIVVTGDHGVRMQYDYTHDLAGLPGTVSNASPRWLRLTRSGHTFVGAESPDGTHWTTVGIARLDRLPSTTQAGLFVASPEHTETIQSFGSTGSTGGPTQATALFDHVDLGGTWAAGVWTGTDVAGGEGGPRQAGPATGYRQAGGGFTVTGTGDIAPKLPGEGAGRTFGDGLLGVFAGLIPVIVVATMFVTAEYRRGLVRTTLAASPRRGRVVAAKALVASSVAFVTGLVSAVVAVPIVERLERAKGYLVFPVSPLTALRVVVGTAVLLAVAAVLAVGLGAVLRRSAASVIAVIVLIVLPYIVAVASLLPVHAAEWLLRLTPAAAFAIQQTAPRYPQVNFAYLPSSGYFPLPPWAGMAVLCGYAALALGLGTLLLRRRDA